MCTRYQISLDVPASILIPLVKISDIETDDPDSPTGKGYQRVATKSRFKKIADHFSQKIDSNLRAIPSLSLNCRDEEICAELEVELDYGDLPFNAEKFAEIVGPGGLFLVDGQHRFGGLKMLLEEQNLDRLVPITVSLGMSIQQEVTEFNSLNQEAKKMSKALAIFNQATITDDHESNDPDVRIRRLANKLREECEPWIGKVGVEKVNRKHGEVVSLEGLRRCLGLFFTSNVVDMLTDEQMYDMANNFFVKLKQALGDNWGSHYLIENGEIVLYAEEEGGGKVRSRTHHLATLAGLCHYGYVVSMWPSDRQNAAFSRLSEVDWAETSEELIYPAGFAGLKIARSVFRDILEV